ncbi:hypothetical protein WICPIJ_007677, partial [Wickerhamomyces pijperi]
MITHTDENQYIPPHPLKRPQSSNIGAPIDRRKRRNYTLHNINKIPNVDRMALIGQYKNGDDELGITGSHAGTEVTTTADSQRPKSFATESKSVASRNNKFPTGPKSKSITATTRNGSSKSTKPSSTTGNAYYPGRGKSSKYHQATYKNSEILHNLSDNRLYSYIPKEELKHAEYNLEHKLSNNSEFNPAKNNLLIRPFLRPTQNKMGETHGCIVIYGGVIMAVAGASDRNLARQRACWVAMHIGGCFDYPPDPNSENYQEEMDDYDNIWFDQ